MHARTTPLLVLPVLGFVLVTSTSQAPHEPERQLVEISMPALVATCTAGSSCASTLGHVHSFLVVYFGSGLTRKEVRHDLLRASLVAQDATER
jgi:hypothetical protein